MRNKELRKKQIQVLMSTYNGEQYLSEQMESILAQERVSITILVRDDGSEDRTIDILEKYARKYPQIKIFSENNLGVWQSFFQLFQRADRKTPYIALADQDDIWLPDKLSYAIEKLEMQEQKEPFLYCSSKILVDEHLNKIQSEIDYSKKITPSFHNALVENICTGCTCVFNQELLSLLIKKVPDYMIMHDWWMYLIASAFGKVIYDTNSYLFYRLHNENVHGTIISKKMLWKHRLQELWKKRGELYQQLEAFDRQYGFELEREKKEALDLVLSSRDGICGRVRLYQNRKIRRQNPKSDRIYRGMVLLGKL